jgi:hypothetical protein
MRRGLSGLMIDDCRLNNYLLTPFPPKNIARKKASEETSNKEAGRQKPAGSPAATPVKP